MTSRSVPERDSTRRGGHEQAFRVRSVESVDRGVRRGEADGDGGAGEGERNGNPATARPEWGTTDGL